VELTVGNRIAAEHIENGILLSDREAWAWFRLDPFHFPFSSGQQRVENALNIQTLFKTFLDPLPEGFEVHLLTTNTAIDTESWERELLDRIDVDENGESEKRSALAPLLGAMKEKISTHYTSDTWLGIKIGERGGKFDLKNIAGAIGKAFSDVAGNPNLRPDDEELEKWRLLAQRLRANVSSASGGRYATVNELTWLISHPINISAEYRKDIVRTNQAVLNGSQLDEFKDSILVEAGAKGGSVIPSNMLEVFQVNEETGEQYKAFNITLLHR